MKKTLAILLTLILTFSCVSLLGTGVAVAEEIQDVGVNLIESDFHKPMYKSSASSEEKKNMSMWIKENAVEYLDDNSDETTDFVRLTGTSKAARLYSSTAVVIPGNTYQVSFDLRIPNDSVAFNGFVSGGNTFDIFPQFVLYQPQNNTAAGTRVDSGYSTKSNDYAYKDILRGDFSATWTIGDYTIYREDFSDFGGIGGGANAYYNNVKDAEGNSITPNALLNDWTTVTMTFKAVEDVNNVGPEVVAFCAALPGGGVDLKFDIKDFTFKCTDNCAVTNTLMQSDFNDADGTNWQGTRNNVVYGDSNGDEVNDFARVSSSTEVAGAGFVSAPFELVNGNDYELSFYLRIPEESKSYKIGTTFYAPTVTLYEAKVNSAGTKVSNISKVNANKADNNYYAYKQSAKDATDEDPAIEAWTRRQNFSAEWTIEGYGSLTQNGSSTFTYKNHATILGTEGDAKNIYSDWTKITAKFTAVADEEGEISQVAALNFHFLDLDKTFEGYMFDIKDVVITETKSKFNPLPDTTNAVYYNSFENIFDVNEAGVTVYGQYNLVSDWAETNLVQYEGTTGKNSLSVFAFGAQYIFIPVDKELLAPGRTYNFSLDWKLPATANDGETRVLGEITFIAYNCIPSTSTEDLHEFTATRKLLGGRQNDKKTLTVTGDWQSFAQTATISAEDYEAYEQFGICIRYPKATTADATKADNTIQIDNIMVTAEPLEGDVNGDDQVDLTDVTNLAQYLAGWDVAVNKEQLDVDGDGLVNLNDLIHLAQLVANWEE